MAKPLQVYVDDDEMKRLEAWAISRGWTKSQAVRAAIRAMTRSPAVDPIMELSGDLDGLPEDAAANFDRYLNETYVAERKATYRPRCQRPRKALRR